MSEEIDFGSMEAANAAREDWSGWVCPVDDDERYKTVAFVSDTPADVLEAIRVEAQDSRTERRQSSTSADLTADERERIKELGGFEGRPTTFSWGSAKGVFAREGMLDKFRDALGALTDYDDPAEGAEEWIQNQRAADATKGTGGASGGSRDEGDVEEQRQRRAGSAARKAREQGCDQAHDYCEGGDEEACGYLREVCGYDEDTVRSILADDREDTEQDDLVTVGGDEYPEMDVTPQEAGALRNSWQGYKSATGRLSDELDDIREAVVNARQAIEAINAIRRNHGQDEMHPNALHNLLDALDELPEEIPEVRTLAHFQHRDEGGEPLDADRFETMPEEPASLPNRDGASEGGRDLPDDADLYAVVHEDGAQEYIRGFEGDKQAAIEHADEMGPAYHVEYSLETGDGSEVDADRFEAPEAPARHPRRADRTKALGRYQRELARDLIELAHHSRHDDAVPAVAHAMRNLSRSEVDAALRAANNSLPASKQYDGDRLGRAAWSEYRYQYGGGTEMERPPDSRHRGRSASVSKFEFPDEPLDGPRRADPDRLDVASDTGSQFASDRQGSLSVGVEAEESPGEKQVTLTGDDATATNHALPGAWSADAFSNGGVVRWGAGPYSVRVTDTNAGYNVVLSGPENSETITKGLRDLDHAKEVAAEFTERLRPPEVSFHSSDPAVPEAAAEAVDAAADENSGLGAFTHDEQDAPDVDRFETAPNPADTLRGPRSADVDDRPPDTAGAFSLTDDDRFLVRYTGNDGGTGAFVTVSGDGSGYWVVLTDDMGATYPVDYFEDDAAAVAAATEFLAENTERDVRALARESHELETGTIRRATSNAVKGRPAEALAERYDSIDEVASASRDELLSIGGVGPKTVDALADHLSGSDDQIAAADD